MVVALICGGGNGAHVAAGLAAAQSGVEARVISLFADEAARWTSAMEGHEFSVSLHAHGKVKKTVGIPTLVTKDPAKAMDGTNIIIFMVPAFAHQQYLEELKPFVKPGMVLAGCPGQAGFDFAVRGIWGDLAREVSILSFESLPWACRMTEFGRSGEVLGTKASLVGAILPGSTPPPEDAVGMLQKCLGPFPKLIVKGHLLGITLMGTNGYLHPCISYGKWYNWDGNAVDTVPLFYNGLDNFSADLLSSVSSEVVITAAALQKARPQVQLNNVVHIMDWFVRCYSEDIVDKSNLYTIISSNAAYAGLVHPCEETPEGKFVPNFKYRYMTEDIPFGLVVMRGVAEIAGIATPNMDKIIYWAQEKMGKEFLVNGKLTGKDIGLTRSPQRYGIHDVDTMLGLA